MLHEFFETGTYWNCLCECYKEFFATNIYWICLCKCYMSSLKLAHNETVHVNVTSSLELAHNEEIVYVNVTWILWNWHIYWNCFCECYMSSLKLTWSLWNWHIYWNWLCECYMSSLKLTWVLWNWHIMKRLFMWMLHEFFETGIYIEIVHVKMLHEFFETGT
jgi:hypothetical protein